MSSPLTPDALEMLQLIAQEGSFAAAARVMGRVPSALTYSIRQLEDQLDVLLFDRSSRQARLTPAGEELVREGQRLLTELEQVAQRVKRVSTGWEPSLVIAVDAIVQMPVVLDLVAEFQALAAPTRLRVLQESLSGTWEALARGRADLAIGVVDDIAMVSGVRGEPLGSVPFVFAVAPQHPLAQAAEPIPDELLSQHTVVATADSAQQGQSVSVGILTGQPVLTMPSLILKHEAQLRGLGVGHLPRHLIEADLQSGRLIEKRLVRPSRVAQAGYAWRPRLLASDPSRTAPNGPALSWWLERLSQPKTRAALIS